jgi:hypothetical protein
MSEEPQPTIENPFGEKPKKKINNTGTSQPSLSRAVQEDAPRDEYNPGYFISSASKTRIKGQLDSGALLKTDLPEMFQISSIIALILNREVPSLSDIDVGLAFKNRENLEKIAIGEIDVDIVRKNHTQEVIARTERIKFWREVANLVVQNLPEKS